MTGRAYNDVRAISVEDRTQILRQDLQGTVYRECPDDFFTGLKPQGPEWSISTCLDLIPRRETGAAGTILDFGTRAGGPGLAIGGRRVSVGVCNHKD
jgi:hypothetical protein